MLVLSFSLQLLWVTFIRSCYPVFTEYIERPHPARCAVLALNITDRTRKIGVLVRVCMQRVCHGIAERLSMPPKRNGTLGPRERPSGDVVVLDVAATTTRLQCTARTQLLSCSDVVPQWCGARHGDVFQNIGRGACK